MESQSSYITNISKSDYTSIKTDKNLTNAVNILEFLTELINNFSTYFTIKFNNHEENFSLSSSNIIIHSKKIIDLTYRYSKLISTTTNDKNNLRYKIISWKGIHFSMECNQYSSSEEQSEYKKAITFYVDFYKYYSECKFTIVEDQPDKDYIHIIKKLFQLKHLMEHGELHSFSKKITSTFIRCYLEYIKYTIKNIKSTYAIDYYYIKVFKNDILQYECQVVRFDLDLLKEEVRNNYTPSDKIEISIRKISEYYSREEDNTPMVIDTVDKYNSKYHRYLKDFIIILECKQKSEVHTKEDIYPNNIVFRIRTLRAPIWSSKIKDCYSIIEFIEYYKKHLESDDRKGNYKEIFSQLLKDRRFVSVKPILQIE